MSTLTSEQRSISPETPTTNLAIHATAILTFSLALVGFNIMWKRRRTIDVDKYLTARRDFSWIPMSLSFFAASGGAWAIFGVPSYVSDPEYGIGLGGLLVLAVANSLSLLSMSFIGPSINKKYPTITSWNDFAVKKFGKGAQALVAFSSLISIFASFTAEYTGTAKLMSSLYNIPPLYSIVATGLLTMSYSSIVGVSVSLFTDGIQTALIAILLLLCGVTLQNFNFGMLEKPENAFLSFTSAGFDSIFTIGLGTFSYYLFSDMCWQRLIATENASSTRRGVYIGSLLCFLSILTMGLFSIISVATTDSSGNQELRLYYSALSCDNCHSINMRALKISFMVMAIIINATSIDNCQSSMTATITSYILSIAPSIKERRKVSVTLARVVQLAANLLCIAGAVAGMKIISYYLISTLIAASSSAPFIVAFNESASKCLSSSSVLTVFGLTTLTNILYYYFAESMGPLTTLRTYYFDEYRKETFIIAVFAPYLYTAIIWYFTHLMKRGKKQPKINTKEERPPLES